MLIRLPTEYEKIQMNTASPVLNRSASALFTLLFFALGCGGPADNKLPLVQEGKARAVVVLPRQADEQEKLAASKIVDYIEKISQVRLATITLGEQIPGEIATRILIGNTARQEVFDL